MKEESRMIDRHMNTERANPKLETQMESSNRNNKKPARATASKGREGFLETCHTMVSVSVPTVPLTRKVEHRNNHRRPATEPPRWDKMPKLEYTSNGQKA
jgi:hypothetical protein